MQKMYILHDYIIMAAGYNTRIVIRTLIYKE